MENLPGTIYPETVDFIQEILGKNKNISSVVVVKSDFQTLQCTQIILAIINIQLID
jgi:hypothetical protein